VVGEVVMIVIMVVELKDEKHAGLNEDDTSKEPKDPGHPAWDKGG
jgi:hypothetical protein